MAETKNIIYLPFDEGSGSSTAFDYTPNRADGTVVDAEFVAGKVGNAVRFKGTGSVDVAKEIMTAEEINGDWSVLAWVKPERIDAGTPTTAVWTVAMEGYAEFVEKRIPVQPDKWTHVALVKKGTAFFFYMNTYLIGTVVKSGTVTGISLSQDYYGSESGMGCVDDFKVFTGAMSAEEMSDQMRNIKMLSYSIDGVDLKDYGVFVSDSEGLIDRPKMKKARKESWNNYHGVMVDLQHKFVEERKITLSCFVKTENGKGEFVSGVNKFLQIFDKKGTHRLMVDIHPTKPLVYEVYMDDEVKVKKTWNDGLMVGTFKLTLMEPSPVKRVLKYMALPGSQDPATIKITTNKMVDVYWGDGKVDPDVVGIKELSHTYEKAGDYYIIVAGCVDEITSFETNSIVVWQKI